MDGIATLIRLGDLCRIMSIQKTSPPEERGSGERIDGAFCARMCPSAAHKRAFGSCQILQSPYSYT